MTDRGKKFFLINDDYFLCVVCTEYWLKRDPRILPCQHIFCKECIEGIWRGSGRKSFISCPSCRRTARWPDNGKDGFPTSRIVSNVSIPSDQSFDDGEDEGELEKTRQLECMIEETEKKLIERCFMHKLIIELVCITCADAKLCRLCWNNHQNHKLMPLSSYKENERFREKCLGILTLAQDHCNKFLDALVQKTRDIENKMAECIQEAKEEILERWFRKVEEILSAIVKLKTNVFDKKLFIERKNERVNDNLLKTIQEEIENQFFDLDLPDEDLRQIMVDFSDRLFLIMEKGSNLEQYIDYDTMINGFQSLILNEETNENNLNDDNQLNNYFAVKYEENINRVKKIHCMIEYLNLIYMSVTEFNGDNYLLIISSKNFSIDERIYFIDYVREMFILRNEIFLCFSDTICSINSLNNPIIRINNIVSSIMLDNNNIVCLTNNCIKKVRLCLNNESLLHWDIGIDYNDIKENLHEFIDLCLWKDKIVVLDSSFSNNFCLFVYDVYSSKDEVLCFGEYEPAKLGLAKPSKFCYPRSVCCVENELLVVSDCGNKRLQIFRNFDQLPSIINLDIHPDYLFYSSFTRELYITEHQTSNILILSVHLPGF